MTTPEIAAALTFGLLVMACEKLGRRAHAETIEVHHAHRDLPSVGVFLAPGETDSE